LSVTVADRYLRPRRCTRRIWNRRVLTHCTDERTICSGAGSGGRTGESALLIFGQSGAS
jgi:hypothetical protein